MHPVSHTSWRHLHGSFGSRIILIFEQFSAGSAYVLRSDSLESCLNGVIITEKSYILAITLNSGSSCFGHGSTRDGSPTAVNGVLLWEDCCWYLCGDQTQRWWVSSRQLFVVLQRDLFSVELLPWRLWRRRPLLLAAYCNADPVTSS